jgi:hypothetical protein
MAAPKYQRQPIPPAIRNAIDELAEVAVDKIVSAQPKARRYRALLKKNWQARLSVGFWRGDGGEDVEIAFRND